MALNLRDCTFFGPALPEPFVLGQLETELNRYRLLPRNLGDEGRALQEAWEGFRRKLRALGEQGGDLRVLRHVLEPLSVHFGYSSSEKQPSVITREGAEDGGTLLAAPGGQKLRVWATALGTDLDAPNRRGRAYRFSPSRVAQRVLLASGERAGLLTDGEELRLLICDPARPDSHISVSLSRSGGWRETRNVPDSYRLFRALASPGGVAALPELTDAARLAQSRVTKKLRVQARKAIEGFLQELLDHPANQGAIAAAGPSEVLAKKLWNEGLILVYRLLFIFKLESSADPARAFSFASTSLWRNTYSPNTALAPLVRKVIDQGADSGGFLEGGLRTLWRMFAGGMSSSELEVKALGGMLFGEGTTPLLDHLRWGERAVALLLDALLWTPGDGQTERERVHYGALDVEDLGRVYEALLELEPGITTEPMCRLRRAKLEVVVPGIQGESYKTNAVSLVLDEDTEELEDAEDEDNEDEASKRTGKSAKDGKTKVLFIEDILSGRFFLRVGLGRKATGSYYTPHPFVRFLVQETLGPQLLECSPKEDPHPGKILELKVLDPAMGSGHFLVESCRYLGEALYEACRLCDELAVQAEEEAEKATDGNRESLLSSATELRKRVEDLPDPDDELVSYLPSRVTEGEESGLSQKKAEALCRRLVAVHCLYGVDKNPLAVELAKLSLWLESYAEGLPLTFMDHRLICGDSLSGPFFEHLLTYPRSGGKLDDLFAQGLTRQLNESLAAALVHVRDLEVSVGKDVADLENKQAAKRKLDLSLKPLLLLAAAWAGGVMLGENCDDLAYQALAQAIGNGDDIQQVLLLNPNVKKMFTVGREAVPFDLVFAEVFYSAQGKRRGFDVVLGNPPWDAIQFKFKEFLAGFDLLILNEPTKQEQAIVKARLLAIPAIANLFFEHQEYFERAKRANDKLYKYQKIIIEGDLAGRQLDAFRVFMERNAQLTKENGSTGVVVPSAFHANAGASGVRNLYLNKMKLKYCFSFENKKNLFDIHRSFKFAAVVATNDSSGTSEFECGFYWQDLERLFESHGRLRFGVDFLRRTGGNYLNMPELRSELDVSVARSIFEKATLTARWMEEHCLSFRMTELHLSHDSHLFHPIPANLGADPRSSRGTASLVDKGFLVVYEGKFFEQYDTAWGPELRYLVAIEDVKNKPDFIRAAEHYRMVFREVSSSTNERTVISALLPPGSLTGHTAPVDETPWARSSSMALFLIATLNSHCFDWLLRFRVSSHVTKFLFLSTPLPTFTLPICRFLSHSALRLTCIHAGYAPLWREQLGETWLEQEPKFTWPVLKGEDARWLVRAAIDAVVADAYCLDRMQYVHVLSNFSHRGYPITPKLCLAAFDELKSVGLDAFTRKYDPYCDIPLNEDLPEPVIVLPYASTRMPALSNLGPLFDVLEVEPGREQNSVTKGTSPIPSEPAENDAYDSIVRLLRARGVIASIDAQEATGLDANRVRPFLNQLVDEGLAEVEGQRRGTRYRRKDRK